MVNPISPQTQLSSGKPLLEKDNKDANSFPNPIHIKIDESSPPLNKKITLLLKEPVPTIIKTESYAGRLFNFVKQTAVKGGLKIVEKSVFSPHAIQVAYDENIRQLEQMTGDRHLGDFLMPLSGLISELATENYGREGVIKQGLEGESAFFTHLTKSMVSKLAVNIGRRLEEEGEEVTLVSIIAYAANFMRQEKEKIKEEIIRVQNIKDPQEKAKALNGVCTPVVDAFLLLVFPGGAKELPLRSKFQNYAWSYLKDGLLAKVVSYEIQTSKTADRIREDSQAELLEVLAKDAETLVKTQGPVFLEDKKRALVAADWIMKTLGTHDKALKDWLFKEVSQLGKQDNFLTSSLWNILGANTHSLLSYVAVRLSDGKHREHHPDTTIISNILKNAKEFNEFLVLEFVEQNGGDIQKHFTELQTQKILPEDDPQFVERFKPLCEAFMELLDLKDKDVLERAFGKFLLDLAPKLLASHYREYLVPLDSLKSSKERLLDLCSAQDTDKALLLDRGVVEQIENVLGVLSQKLLPFIKEIAGRNIQKFIGEVSEDPFPLYASQELYLQNVIKSLFMQGVVNYLEEAQKGKIKTAESSETHSFGVSSLEGKPLFEFLEKIARILEKHLHEDASEIQRAALLGDSENESEKKEGSDHKKQALRFAFTPLTHSLVQLFAGIGKDRQEVPLNIPFGSLSPIQGIWKKIEEEWIPDFLASCYLDTTSLARNSEDFRRQIVAETNTRYLPESCKVLSRWISDFLPAFLTLNKYELAEGIYDGVSQFLTSGDSFEGVSISRFLSENEIFIKKNICEELFSFFSPNSEFVMTSKPLTHEYLEAFLLKACARLSTKVNEVQGRDQASQADFMIQFGINFLKTANEHVGLLNNITLANKSYTAHKVSHKKFIQEFGENLHPGVSREMEAQNAIKQALLILENQRRLFDKATDPLKKMQCLENIKIAKNQLREAKAIQSQERQRFFKALTENLMKLSGINQPSDLPFPESLRDKCFDLFQNQLLPSVLENFFEILGSPSMRNNMLIAGLKNLNQALDSVSDEVEEDLVCDDEVRKKLNKVCGELVLQLVQLVPQSMIKAAFKIDKLKILETQSAEIIGKAVLKYLSIDLNLLKILDSGLLQISNLVPGHWKIGEGGVFFECEISDEEPLSFPLDDDELEKSERKKIRQLDREKKEMRMMMIKSTRRVLSDAIKDFFIFPFFKINLLWKAAVNKVFGKYSQEVNNFFSFIGEKTIFRLIETCLSLLSYPFRAAFWFFMEIHIGNKVDHFIRNLHLDIHENLLYRLTDLLIDTLNEGTKPATEENLQRILQAAENRSIQEKIENVNYFRTVGIDIDNAKEWWKKQKEKKTGPESQNPSEIT